METKVEKTVRLDPAKLETRFDCGQFSIEPARTRAYALATNDPNPAYLEGGQVPPMFSFVPVFEGVATVVGLVAPDSLRQFIVHGSHDLHIHRPIEAGMTLESSVSAYAFRRRGSSTAFIEVLRSFEGTELVLEQFSSFTIRGHMDSADAGPEPPAHAFPEGARAQRVGEYTVHVDPDQSYRYAGASGDHSKIHIFDNWARAVGLPGIILQGMCTMAMCSQAVIQTAAGGDPRRLRRLAVQFAGVVLPGNDIVTQIYDAGPIDGAEGRHAYAFEALSAARPVIRHGWAEIVP